MAEISRVFVFTRDHNQFLSWCSDNNFNPKDRRIVCLERSEQLRGIINPIVLKWGEWYQHNDVERILEMIAVRTREVMYHA